MAEQWERYEERLSLTRVTYVIPCGVGWDAIQRALDQAKSEWRELTGQDVDAPVPPEAVTWRGLGREMQVCIEAEVEESDAGPEPAGDQPGEAPEEVQERV